MAKKKPAKKEKVETPENVTLAFMGEFYRGDGLVCRGPGLHEVKPEKARQLLKDFPDTWLDPGSKKGKAAIKALADERKPDDEGEDEAE